VRRKVRPGLAEPVPWPATPPRLPLPRFGSWHPDCKHRREQKASPFSTDLTKGRVLALLRPHCLGKPPAVPEDSRSSTISGMVGLAVSNSKPNPLTLTLSHGRGNRQRQVRFFGRIVGQTPHWVVRKASGGFSLSPRKRAGVRGKLTLAVLPGKSAARPKGRMALSNSFFHAPGFASGR